MNEKHTKLKKSLFLILICISLTTSFVVSASAASIPDTDYTVTIELYTGDPSDSVFYQELGPFPAYPINTGVTLSFIVFNIGPDLLFFEGFPVDPYSAFYVTIADLSDPYSSLFLYQFSFNIDSTFTYCFLNDGRLLEISRDENPNIVETNLYIVSPGFWPYDPSYTDTRYVVRCYGQPFSSDSPSFTGTVGSGLTSSLSWVGQVVESLTNGSIKPLLGCFAVTISVSAVLLGIYSIKRFIWGK